MKSVWNQDVLLKVNKELEHDTSVNTVIIGGGMTGILTAYLLKKRGVDTIVLEAKRIGSGQTQNTTAKITSQHGLFYSKMVYKMGWKRLKGYAMACEAAIDKYEQIIRAEKIDCDFMRMPSVLYTTEEVNKRLLRKEAKIAQKLGIDAFYKDEKTENKDVTCTSLFSVNEIGAVYFNNQAQFHPLKFLEALIKELTIYENTLVHLVKGHTVYTSRGKIEADHIVFASHYPFINFPGFYFLRQHQERSYVLAVKTEMECRYEGCKKEKKTLLPAMYYSADKNGLSLRSYKDLIFLGGGAHRTGKRTTCKNEETGYTFLCKMKEKYYPKAEIAAAWSAQDCMPHDNIPFIGKYSLLRPYWYVASGFKKWGMTASMIAAEIISSDIRRNTDCGNTTKDSMNPITKNAYVFSPQRFLPLAGWRAFFADIRESVVGLCKGLFCLQERRCPHMGCRLEWNAEEKSWDCPCHGSRFTNEGELIDNPAQTNL